MVAVVFVSRTVNREPAFVTYARRLSLRCAAGHDWSLEQVKLRGSGTSRWLVKSDDRYGLEAYPYSKLHCFRSRQVSKRFGFSDEANGPDEGRHVYIEISVWVRIEGVGHVAEASGAAYRA